MKVFLDTEFTGLLRPPNERKLISLAVVAEDGSTEWYAELDGWTAADCDPWVHENVLPHLTGERLPWCTARQSLQAWFAALPVYAQVACDSGFDWFYLLDLFGGRPDNLDPQRYDLTSLLASSIYRHAFSDYFVTGRPAHHALHEARAHRLGWLAWLATTRVPPPAAIQLRLDLR